MKYCYLLILLFLIIINTKYLSAQESFMQPYSTDENTVLLLHFDDNLDNSASTGGSAILHGTPVFVNSMNGFGKAIFLDNHINVINDSTIEQPDTTFILLDEIPELNLSGDFTIEGWFKYADTLFYEGNNPSYLVSKIDSTGKFNYRVWSDLSGPNIMAGYQSANSTWMINDPQNTISFKSSEKLLNKWYHFIFQRDATLRVVTLAIHDEEGNLVDFEFRQSHEAYDLPVSSSLPLFLGRQSPDGSGFFHGYLDEIRISNSLRYFDLPPVILYKHYLSNVESSEKIGNQYDDVSEYEVDLNIAVLGSHNGVKDAKIFYRLVDDPYEKVLMDDPSWNEVSMTQIEGDNFKGAIPKQPLGTIIDYYTTATSITGKTTVFGAYPDTMYDRFGVMRRNDVVLKLSFEEEDMNFVDSSVYNNQLVKFGNWVLWDDPDDVPEGEYCVYLTEGSFGMGEIKSPFLSLERYTVTLWVEPDTLAHNVYIISNTPRGNWWEDNYTILHRYKQIKNDAYHDNRWPGEFPWQGDMAYVSAGENGKWSHYLINCGPERLVVQRNDENDNPIERLVWTNNGKGWTKGFIPRVPSNGKFRIGPPTTPGPGTPFYEGKLDELVVYNYQTLPGNFKKSPPTSIHHDLVNPPKKYKLYQNYPNPFNPQTTIKFEIPKNTLVTLKIYDLRGRLIKTLYKNEKAEAGIYKILWDGTNEYGKLVSSGVYIYQLKTKDFIKSNKMILIK